MAFPLRYPLALLALCAIGGIVAADQLDQGAASRGWPWALGVALLCLLAATLSSRTSPRSRAAQISVGLATVALFFAWHAYLVTRGPGAALAALIPEEGCVVEAVGVVDDEPAADTPFQLRLEALTLGGKTLQTSAPVLVTWMGDLPRYGDRMEITGDLHRLAPPRNPGGFERPKIWQRRGVYAQLKVRYPNDTRLLAHHCGSAFVSHALALRHAMERTMALDLEDSPQLVALIQSMVLGAQGESMEETRKLFQYTGTLHLFAVSGMNVAMLAGISAGLLQAAGVKRRVMVCLVIPLLWIYCYATGLTASSLRATVMATVALAGFLIDRPALSWNTLGAATLAILVWNPNQLFTPGFQLSFGMVAFLMAAAGRIQKRLKPFTQPDPFLPRTLWSRWLVLRCWLAQEFMGALAVSTIAWIGSMPLMVYYFHLWSPSTVPANVFAVLFAWIMLVLGLASVLAGTFWTGLAIIFNNTNWLVAKLLLGGISAFASLPGGHVYVALPSLQPTPLCEVEVLDVSGGAAIHLRTHSAGRRDWLLDCGSASAFTYTVSPYLRSRGVNTLDGFLLTHGDAQHIGGSAELLSEMAPNEVIDSPLRDRSAYRRGAHATLEALSKGKAIVSRGDTLTLAPGIMLHVLFPPEGLRVGSADDKAFVLRLDAAGKRFLFTSDAGFSTEHWLLENAPREELRSDLLIKAMHAKDFSGTPEFLQAVGPSLIVASSTAFPPEKHIPDAWAAQVEALGIRLLRQDRTGAVHITLKADGAWQAEPFLGEK